MSSSITFTVGVATYAIGINQGDLRYGDLAEICLMRKGVNGKNEVVFSKTECPVKDEG